MIKWRPMQHEKDLSGDVVMTIWKSRKVAWHWIALYRYPKKRNTGLKANYGDIQLNWNFRGKAYTLMFMEWLGFPRKYRRIIR